MEGPGALWPQMMNAIRLMCLRPYHNHLLGRFDREGTYKVRDTIIERNKGRGLTSLLGKRAWQRIVSATVAQRT